MIIFNRLLLVILMGTTLLQVGPPLLTIALLVLCATVALLPSGHLAAARH